MRDINTTHGERHESTIVCEGHVQWLPGGQEEGQDIYHLCQKPKTQAGALLLYHNPHRSSLFFCSGKDS